MEKMTIDECLTSKLRFEIEKLIDLNLDLNSIWDLIQDDLEPYETYMQLEVQRFIKYLLWLRDNNKNRNDAFLKYKRYTVNLNPNFRNEVPISDLEQKWKDQRRIDELSALMNYHQSENSPSPETLSETQRNQETIEPTNNVLYNFESNETVKETPEVFEDYQLIEEEEETKQQIDFTEQIEAVIATLTDAEIDRTINDLVKTEHITLSATLDRQINEIHNIADQEPSLLLNNDGDIIFETIIEKEENTNEIPTFEPFLEDNGTQTFNESFYEPQETKPNHSTEDALDFLQKMEEKYDHETINLDEINSQKTSTLLIANEQDVFNHLGEEIIFQDEIYLIKKVEVILDFFKHPQTIVILENLENQQDLRINARKLLGKV